MSHGSPVGVNGRAGVGRLGEPLLWAGLYALSFALRFLQSPVGAVAHEELHTPTVATWLAGTGDLGHLFELQYMAQCGGCTAETLLVLPAFVVLGPGLPVWKAVPLAFGLAITALVWSLAGRIGGRAAARLAVAAWILAPTWVGANTMVAFGGHFEVMALVLLAVLATDRQARDGDLARQGLLLGLAFWFDYASAFAVPVLLVAAGRRAGRVALGLLAGLVPWIVTQAALAASGRTAGVSWLAVSGMEPERLLRGGPGVAARASELCGPDLWRSMWNPAFAAPTAGLLVTVLAGAAAVATLLRRDRTGRVVGALILVYAALYLLLAPTGMARPEGAPLTANALRYLMPLAPLVAVALGSAGALALEGRWRGLGAAAALLLLGTGLTARLVELDQGEASVRPLRLLALDQETLVDRLEVRPDGTLPGGTHPRGRARDLALLAAGYRHLGADLLADGRDGRWRRAATLLAQADGLPPDEAALLLEGAALRLQHDGGWLDGGSAGTPPPRLRGLLHSSDAGEALARALLRHEPRQVVDDALDALGRDTDPFGAEGPWRLAVAWAAGRTAGIALAREREPAAWAPELRGEGAPLEDSLARAFYVGAGEGLGAWGARTDVDAVLTAFPEAADALAEGRAAARRRVGWW